MAQPVATADASEPSNGLFPEETTPWTQFYDESLGGSEFKICCPASTVEISNSLSCLFPEERTCRTKSYGTSAAESELEVTQSNEEQTTPSGAQSVDSASPGNETESPQPNEQVSFVWQFTDDASSGDEADTAPPPHRRRKRSPIIPMSISPRRLIRTPTAGTQIHNYRNYTFTSRRDRTFTNFPKLPAEIQQMVWRYAVPDPRDIGSAIIVIVNFDLNEPRAILLSPKHINEFRESRRRLIGIDLEFIWAKWSEASRSVLNLLHSCHNARSATLNTFCLDLQGSSSPWNTRLWNPEADVLYLTTRYRPMMLNWLSESREKPYLGLAGARHVALPLDRYFLKQVNIRTRLRDLDAQSARRQTAALLGNLPALQHFELFIDPSEAAENTEGRIALYEPEDVPIKDLNRHTALEIQSEVAKRFKGSLQVDDKVPLVEVSVIGWVKPRS